MTRLSYLSTNQPGVGRLFAPGLVMLRMAWLVYKGPGMNANDLATLRFAFADAHAALLVAQADKRWTLVAKYASELAQIQREIDAAHRADATRGDRVWG